MADHVSSFDRKIRGIRYIGHDRTSFQFLINMQSARFKEYGQKVLTNELYIMINEISITVKLFVAETLQSIQL